MAEPLVLLLCQISWQVPHHLWSRQLLRRSRRAPRSRPASGLLVVLDPILTRLLLCMQEKEKTNYMKLPQPVKYEDIQREIMSASRMQAADARMTRSAALLP